MTTVVVDDHLLRDVLTAERPRDLGGLATALATTGLWLFRLSSSWATPDAAGRLSGPVAALPLEQQDRFRAQLMALPDEIEVDGFVLAGGAALIVLGVVERST